MTAPVNPPTTRNDAFEAALSRLVEAGTLTPDQARAVLDETRPILTVYTLPSALPPSAQSSPSTTGPRRPPASAPSWTALLSELGGYVGGAFVVAAVAVVTGPKWDELGQAARVAVFGVPAVLLAVAAVVVALTSPGGWTVTERRGTTSRRRLVSVLLLVAAGLGGGVAAVLNDGSDDAVAYFVTAFVLAAVGYAFCRGFVLHAGMAVAAAWAASSIVIQVVDDAEPWTTEQRAVGLVLVALALAWAALAWFGVLAERALGLFAAGVIAFIGGEALATVAEGQNWAGYVVLAALAAASLVGYLRLHHVGLLAIGIVSLAVVVPQAVIDYTDGALGAAGALLVTGLSIVGASAAGLRLRKGVSEEAVH